MLPGRQLVLLLLVPSSPSVAHALSQTAPSPIFVFHNQLSVVLKRDHRFAYLVLVLIVPSVDCDRREKCLYGFYLADTTTNTTNIPLII